MDSSFLQKLKDIRPVDLIVDGGPLIRFVALIVGSVVVFPSLWLLADYVTSSPGNRVTLFTGLTSAALTIGVLWVYFEIARQTSEQTELINKQMQTQVDLKEVQKTQTELMEAEYIPELVVTGYGFNPDKTQISLDCKRENQVRISIANPGSISARSLSARLLIDYKDELSEHGFWIKSEASPLLRMNPTGKRSPRQAGQLAAGSEPADFRACLRLRQRFDRHGRPLEVDQALEKLIGLGVDHVRIGLVLETKDRKNDTHTIDVQGWDRHLKDLEEGESPTMEWVSGGEPIALNFIRERNIKTGIANWSPEGPAPWEDDG